MQQDAKALAQADVTVANALAMGNIDEFISEIADPDALSALMEPNVRDAIQFSVMRDDTVHTMVTSAMLYGFLWGHQAASDARNAAAANVGG